MTLFRRALTAFSLAALTAAGCGQLATSPPAPETAGPIVAAGKSRKLGYDSRRYKQVLAKKAKPRKLPRQGILPARVDRRADCAPVYDQGQLGSCTAFAMGKGLREMMARQHAERTVPLSALFLYYETRARLDSVNQDSGGTITDGMAVLEKVGMPPDETWPYLIRQFKVKPPAPAYAAAGEFKVKEAVQLAGLDDVRQALAKGQGVAFGFLVYKSLMNVGKSGVMPMPKPGERVLGGHAVLAVGYDDQKRQLIVRNSWSEQFGDKGYFYMPYDFAQDPELAMDFWTAN